MCYQQRFINNYYGRPILVKCGRCGACLQEKAYKRSSRIRNEYSEDGSKVCLFVTLTYRNESAPYFRLSELRNSAPNEDGCYYLNIYRDSVKRMVRSKRSYRQVKKVVSETKTLQRVLVDPKYKNHYFKTLKRYSPDKIGVCFYKDIQDYFKRVRRKLEYRQSQLPCTSKYDIDFSYYSCSEYGPSTCRPHFHFLLFIPVRSYQLFKDVLSTAWTFDDGYRTKANIEIAKDAATYLATYVNCSSSVPPLFRNTSELRPKHSYSQGFGMAKKCFSFPEVAKAIARRNLKYHCLHIRDHASVVDDFIFPEYVLARYFPKFKGYCNLSDYDLIGLLQRPDTIKQYATKLGLSDVSECQALKVLITHKLEYGKRFGYNPIDYAILWTSAWRLRASTIIRDSLTDVEHFKDYAFAYDNIADYFSGHKLAPTLSSLTRPDSSKWNPNKFPQTMAKNTNLLNAFFFYDKQRKVRNKAMDIFDFHV